MRKRWREAPRRVRRIVTIAYALLTPVLIAQLIATLEIVRGVQAKLAGGDMFASLLEPTPRSPLMSFAIGFSVSTAAGIGLVAVVAATRLLVPYRSMALKLVRYCTAGQILMICSNLVGLVIAARPLDAQTVGTMSSLLYTLPVLLLSFDRVVRAWSVQFVPPPPPLPEGAE